MAGTHDQLASKNTTLHPGLLSIESYYFYYLNFKQIISFLKSITNAFKMIKGFKKDFKISAGILKVKEKSSEATGFHKKKCKDYSL